jgi:hypothetical protein
VPETVGAQSAQTGGAAKSKTRLIHRRRLNGSRHSAKPFFVKR